MIKYVKFPDERKKKYSLMTKIIEENGKTIVRKEAIDIKAKEHIKQIYSNYKRLVDLYGKEHIAFCKLVNDSVIDFEYVIGVSAGSCNGVSFIAKNYRRQHDIIINYSNDKRYMGAGNMLKGHSFLNTDWIFGELVRHGSRWFYRIFIYFFCAFFKLFPPVFAYKSPGKIFGFLSCGPDCERAFYARPFKS